VPADVVITISISNGSPVSAAATPGVSVNASDADVPSPPEVDEAETFIPEPPQAEDDMPVAEPADIAPPMLEGEAEETISKPDASGG
jgi:hypothetical protein